MPDRSVLVTGVAGEIGGYLVDQFLKEGWNVCGLDLRPCPVTERSNFLFQECDLSVGDETENAIEGFHHQVGAFDAVVNCAGLIANSPLMSFVEGRLVHHDFRLWDQVIASCLSSAFYVSACVAPKMAAAGKKSVIINVSSICAHGNAGQAAYSAAKAGLNGLTLSLAKELGPLGIRVVALAPGYFDTNSTRNHVSATRLKELKAAVPLKRLGQLEEIATAVKFVLVDGYLTGTVLELDGGLVL